MRIINMPVLQRVVAVLFVVLAGTAQAGSVAAQDTRIGIERGALPAGPTLMDVQGGEVDLSDRFGEKPVLLEFWATWCENCEDLYPDMLEAHRRYGERVDFFAVAVAVGQSERRVRSHLEKHPVPYPTLWDGQGEAVRAFETPATSYIVILDADGRVAYTGLGRDQDVDGAIREVLNSEPAD
ncbi:MAG: TlpA family protein disulfide reductase [Gemmatimonadetes bacterium]|nr:TlpA family protein disulfide reductase [Gemmatimonadota bacterium]